MTQTRPARWPRFSSTIRSTALTARLGAWLGAAIGVCFVTGLLSHYQYGPWEWLPEPAGPIWAYRLSQGLHVATGTASIPLVLLKLWSVYPNLFRWPPFPSLRKSLERVSVALLVSSTLVQLTTGYLNTLNWYPFQWNFPVIHYASSFVVVGSLLLHIAIKLPDIVYGLQTKLAHGDVLTEIPWSDNPDSHSNAGPLPAPPTPGLSRRGVLIAAGAGVGLVVVTTVGQTLTPLEPLGLLAVRQPSLGPQLVPVNKTAEQAHVIAMATDPSWRLEISGPRTYSISLAQLESFASNERRYPISCVEGWSINADWRGLSLLDLVSNAGGDSGSRVRVVSLEADGYNSSEVFGPQLGAALLATHLNGERLDIDHGYPLRLIVPNRPGVLNTKWLTRVEVI